LTVEAVVGSMSQPPTFEVESSGEPAAETLLVALAQPGMANLTAADYLVRHSDAPEVGFVDSPDLPAMTPVEDGAPRRHTRVFDLPESDFAVLVGELFVPVQAARGLTTAVSDWARDVGIAEVLLLHGIPFPHAETQHEVLTVGTEAFRTDRLGESTAEPLSGGFLDGVPGEFLHQGLDRADLSVGALVTPAHPPGPDMEAAIRLLEVVDGLYALDLDLGELEEAAEQTRKHFEELGERMRALQESDEATGSRDYPIDRMYM
jgi:uncharacterized protein